MSHFLRRLQISHFFISWAKPLVIKGFSSPLVPHDVPLLGSSYDPRTLTEKALEMYAQFTVDDVQTGKIESHAEDAKSKPGSRLWR